MKLGTLVQFLLIITIMACQSSGDNSNSSSSSEGEVHNSDKNAVANVKEWKAASRILNRAGKLIEEKGWQQGAITPDSHECLTTALEHAFNENDYTIVDFNYAREAISRVIKVEREPSKQVGDPLDVPYWGRELMNWNDSTGRTKEEVIQALNEASKIATELSTQANTTKK